MTQIKPDTSIYQQRINAKHERLMGSTIGNAMIEPEPAPATFTALRLLPILVVVAGLLLGFKVVSIFSQSDEVVDWWFGTSPAIAQDEGAEVPAGNQQSADSGAEAQQQGPEAGPQLGEGRSLLNTAVNRDGSVPAPDQPADHDDTFDPASLTASEFELLQSLAERRNRIDQQESEVELRENLLQATERRIDEKIEELKRIEQTITSLVQTYDEQQENKLKSLVKIYETMKPKSAAAIFETLEMSILLDVVERMREPKLALILQSLSAERAKEITTELRARRQLPEIIDGG